MISESNKKETTGPWNYAIIVEKRIYSVPIGKMGARVYIIGQYCVQGHNRAIYGKLTPLTGCLQACIIGAAVKILFSENTKYPSNHLGKRISPVECNSDYTSLRLISRNLFNKTTDSFF
jgi:hypothetical protein